MIEIEHGRDPRYLYKNYPNMGVIAVKVEGSGFVASEELTILEAISLRDKLTEMIESIADTSVDADTAERLKGNYNKAPFDGSSSEFWTEEGKDAYQDGFASALDLLGMNVEGINS
jgi:hypothetical protein